MCFLAHLVYQPKSLIQPWFVCCWHHWCWCHHHLCTPPPGTGLEGNFTFGIHMHACPPHMHIKYLVFKWQPFWYFSLICCPAHTDSHRDLILHILMYHFFTFIHKRNNATATFFLQFMSIFFLLL